MSPVTQADIAALLKSALEPVWPGAQFEYPSLWEGKWHATVELPTCSRITYDEVARFAKLAGTTDINFVGAYEGGWYPGEGESFIQVDVAWNAS